jgi:hypothetical protein
MLVVLTSLTVAALRAVSLLREVLHAVRTVAMLTLTQPAGPH